MVGEKKAETQEASQKGIRKSKHTDRATYLASGASRVRERESQTQTGGTPHPLTAWCRWASAHQ